MPTPVSAQRFAEALRKEGVTVVETDGWTTRNREGHGDWGPLHGVMIHHTVTGPKVNAVPICRDGYDQLPGPLCHGVIRRDGTVHLVGYGRANHAGGGDPAVLAAVKAENYNNRPPIPHEHQGSDGAVDGNAHFMGFECENLGDGNDPWPDVQVDAIVKAATAVCRIYGWSDKSVIGHSEWSDWKNDPRGPGITMPDIRRRVAGRLASSSHRPAPTTPKDDTMDPVDIWAYRNPKADEASVKAGHGRIPDAYAYLTTLHGMVKDLREQVALLRNEVAALRREANR